MFEFAFALRDGDRVFFSNGYWETFDTFYTERMMDDYAIYTRDDLGYLRCHDVLEIDLPRTIRFLQ